MQTGVLNVTIFVMYDCSLLNLLPYDTRPPPFPIIIEADEQCNDGLLLELQAATFIFMRVFLVIILNSYRSTLN